MTNILNILIIVVAIILFLSNGLVCKIIIILVLVTLLLILSLKVINISNIFTLLVTLVSIFKGKKTNKLISIDLGTTASRVGVYVNGGPKIITNDRNESLIPSYVAFTDDGRRLIGSAARDQLIDNPQNTIFNVQRLMGCQWTDQIVQENIENFSFNVIERNGQLYIKIHTAHREETFAPELISAMIIGQMKEIAETYLGERVTHAIITVPAKFNDAQRQAVETAANISGLKVSSLINASTAAAIAYNSHTKKSKSFWKRSTSDSQLLEKKKTVLVFDLGGGHFDCSLISIDNSNFKITNLFTDGNASLGGEDFNRRVLCYFIKLHRERTGRDIQQDSKVLQKLRIDVEEAKKALSDSDEVTIEIKSFMGCDDFVEILSREKFEEINNDLFMSTIETVERALREAKMNKKDVDEIILVGGSTRIPKIQQLLKDFFEARKLYLSIDDSVCLGAAKQINREGSDVVDVQNVTSFSLGVEDAGVRGKRWVSEIIPKNTVIPVEQIVYPETDQDGQNSVFVRVYEGEKGMTKNNRLLGEFELTNIRPAPAGKTIKVTLKINNNGILEVSAEDTETGNRSQITTVCGKQRRSSEEIEQMIHDFERYADE